jgi:hypothetical protein
MNDIETLPHMLKQAMAALDNATTAAEILEAHERAGAAYDLAKRAARFAKVKDAHGKMLAACHRMQADALMIEARAQIRLADEYDAAQDRGDMQKRGAVGTKVLDGNFSQATLAEIGITKAQIHAARQIRDTEQRTPGMIKKTVDAKLDAGEEPTRADVRRAANPHKDTDYEHDRKTCIALYQKMTDAEHALVQWRFDHPGAEADQIEAIGDGTAAPAIPKRKPDTVAALKVSLKEANRQRTQSRRINQELTQENGTMRFELDYLRKQDDARRAGAVDQDEQIEARKAQHAQRGNTPNAAFLLRADEALTWAVFDGKLDDRTLKAARATASAWSRLVEQMETKR